MIKVKVRVEGLEGLGDRMIGAAHRGAGKAVEALPRAITEVLRQGKKPSSGASQPALAESTLRRKRRLGQPETALVATGLLTTPSQWVVNSTAPGRWTVEPPDQRAEAVYWLEQREFEAVSPPTEWIEKTLPEAIDAALAEVR